MEPPDYCSSHFLSISVDLSAAAILRAQPMASHEEEDAWEALAVGEEARGAHDRRSGYCKETGIYYSLHRLGPGRRFPADPHLDVASFVLSQLPHPDHAHTEIALVDSVTGQRVTYAQLRYSVCALAAALHHGLGVCRGDIVFLLSPNSVLYPVVCLAVLSTGGVLTTANPLNTASEVAKQVRHSGAKLAIVAPEEAHKLAATGVPVVLTARRKDDDSHGGGLLSVEELIEGGDPAMAPAKVPCGQHDPAAILYSSGTTGPSKGVVLTHGNLIAVVTLLQWAVYATASHEDVFLAFLPMFHVYGLAFFVLGLFCCAGPPTVVVMPRFDLGLALDAMKQYSVTNIPAVPPVLLGLVRAAASGGHDLSRLRRVGSGAAPLGPSLCRAFRERHPWVELREGYGLTESGGAATFFVSAAEAKKREGSVGRLMPGYQAKVVEVESGRAAGPGGVGELWLRGPGVMKEYLGDDAATGEALVEAGGERWLRTGDLCYFDEDGFLYVVDRIKELIKHNGYQVAPAELEALLISHPHILDAAVIPVEDEEAGQIPMAYVVRSERGRISEEDVILFVASQVAPYKKIRRVAFIDIIPRSPAGKILRRQLMAQSRLAVPSKL